MGTYDSDIFKSLGLEMVEVDEDELDSIPALWQYILTAYPRDEVAFPSYISLETREVIIGGCSKRELRLLVEQYFLPQCKVDGETIPFRKERVLMAILPRLSEFGWGVVTLEPPLFYQGNLMEPPTKLELPDGKVIEVRHPGDFLPLFLTESEV